MNATHIGLAMAAPLLALKGCSEQEFKDAVLSRGERWNDWEPLWREGKRRVQEILLEREVAKKGEKGG